MVFVTYDCMVVVNLSIICCSFIATRTLSKTECPLKLKLQCGTHSSVLEIRLVKVNEQKVQQSLLQEGEDGELVDEQLVRARRGSVPKDEGMSNMGAWTIIWVLICT